MEERVPILCGGTFFVLLLRAKKRGGRARDREKGKKDAFRERDILGALLKNTFHDTRDEILGSACSEFKKCERRFDSFLEDKNDSNIHSAVMDFDERIKDDYESNLKWMEEFVDKYIRPHEKPRIRLVKQLLELIRQDKTIQDNAIIYVCKTGKALKEISRDRECLNVYLPAFLLGIWHYAVVNRPDNTIGQATFKSWHKEKKSEDDKYRQWIYIGNIGEDCEKEIHLLSELPTDSDKFISPAPNMIASEDEVLGDSRVSISEDKLEGKISGEETSLYSQATETGAALAVPQECRICLCCKDWQGDVSRAFRDPDGIYGDCDAQGKRVLSTGICSQFRAEYSRLLQYQECLKLPNITMFRRD